MFNRISEKYSKARQEKKEEKEIVFVSEDYCMNRKSFALAKKENKSVSQVSNVQLNSLISFFSQRYSQGQISFSRLQCPDSFLFIDINPSLLLPTNTYKHKGHLRRRRITSRCFFFFFCCILFFSFDERKKTLNTIKSAQSSLFVPRLFFLLFPLDLSCFTSTIHSFFSPLSR
jgi:hypothetical protein